MFRSEKGSVAGGRRTVGIQPPRSPDSPLVSIITAVLDRAAPLELTISSVLAQTYPYIEYVIIDGGSGPATLRVIDQYLDRVDREHVTPYDYSR